MNPLKALDLLGGKPNDLRPVLEVLVKLHVVGDENYRRREMEPRGNRIFLSSLGGIGPRNSPVFVIDKSDLENVNEVLVAKHAVKVIKNDDLILTIFIENLGERVSILDAARVRNIGDAKGNELPVDRLSLANTGDTRHKEAVDDAARGESNVAFEQIKLLDKRESMVLGNMQVLFLDGFLNHHRRSAVYLEELGKRRFGDRLVGMGRSPSRVNVKSLRGIIDAAKGLLVRGKELIEMLFNERFPSALGNLLHIVHINSSHTLTMLIV